MFSTLFTKKCNISRTELDFPMKLLNIKKIIIKLYLKNYIFRSYYFLLEVIFNK